MSQHTAKVSWKRETSDFEYDTYGRNHAVEFPGGVKVPSSAAPEYKGDPKLPNPEELLVAALSSCHMLTFLAICAKSRLTVDSYSDSAEGTLEKNAEGVLCVTRVTLRPKVVFSGEKPTPEKLQQLHDKAHRNCFIGNSVKCAVSVEFT